MCLITRVYGIYNYFRIYTNDDNNMLNWTKSNFSQLVSCYNVILCPPNIIVNELSAELALDII